MSDFKYMPETDPSKDGMQKYNANAYFDAMLYGGKCLGYRKLTFDDDPAVGFADIADPDGGGALTGGIPEGAKIALCIVEADASQADNARVARFRQDGSDPTSIEGMPVGDNGTFEIRGSGNIAAFKIIGITAAKTHTLRVEFYGAG